jgi:hypothetical protein
MAQAGYYYNDGEPDAANWIKLVTETDLALLQESSQGWQFYRAKSIFRHNQ